MHIGITIQSTSVFKHPSNTIPIIFTSNLYLEITPVSGSFDSILPFFMIPDFYLTLRDRVNL